MRFSTYQQRLKSIVHMDATLGYALGTRIWQTLSAVITLILVLRLTEPLEQGVFYTFNSLANLQIFFEMGLSFVLLQCTPHYFTELTWGKKGKLLGPEEHLETLLAFAQKGLRWYAWTAASFVVVMLPFGLFFFHLRHDVRFDCALPWILLILGMTGNLVLAPILALLEGSGKIKEIYRLRLRQLMIANLLAWIFLVFSHAVYLTAINAWITMIYSAIWLWKTHPSLITSLFKAPSPQHFSWKKEIWPMQWRIALSWISGYVINQIFTPFLFYFQGPIVSGQTGICLTIMNMLGIFAITWVTVRSPKMGELVALKQRKKLDKVFFTAFWQSVGIYIFAALAIIAAYLLLPPSLKIRFLPLSEILGLLIAYLFIHIIGALALYLRAHRIELFTPLSVIGAILMAIGACIGAAFYSSTGVVWSILMVNGCFGFPTALWLWVKFKRKWAQDDTNEIDFTEAYN